MIRIYTMTHRAFDVPPDPLYVPLQVGSALHEALGYLRDDTGDNISHLNGYYSELTGLYWIWKNVSDVDYVGTCHYRRFLINEQERIFTRKEYENLLQEYDLITTRQVILNNSYHYGFAANHNIVALDATGEVIRELYPDYYGTFVRLVNGPRTYFGNIFVTDKASFDEYCSWLFSIFFEVQRRIDMETEQDAYHRRVFGFISEFLLLVWTTVKGLRVYECKVGMLGEKAETREMKERLAEFFARKDIAGAKTYFLRQHAMRPDVMMEASDITGELHLAMQVIATAESEQRLYGTNILEKEQNFKALMELFAGINRVVTNRRHGLLEPRDERTLADSRVSAEALKIAEMILPVQENRQCTEIYRRMAGE